MQEFKSMLPFLRRVNWPHLLFTKPNQPTKQWQQQQQKKLRGLESRPMLQSKWLEEVEQDPRFPDIIFICLDHIVFFFPLTLNRPSEVTES